MTCNTLNIIKMKSIKSLIILVTLLYVQSSNAQLINDFPKFKNEILIVRTFEEVGTMYNSTLAISDGSEVKFTKELKTVKPKNLGDNIEILAVVILEVKRQGYKLIGTNSGGGGGGGIFVITNYIFQKE